MPVRTLNFLIDMYHENDDELFSAFTLNEDLDDIVEIEDDYLELVATLARNESALSQILPRLDSENSEDENNQIALLGLCAKREEHWQYVLNTLFSESSLLINNIDFRWLISRLPSLRQHEIVSFMLSNPKRYHSGFSTLEAFISANKIESLYSLFINKEHGFLHYENRYAYSILAHQGEREILSGLFNQESDDFLKHAIAHWQLYAGDKNALDFFAQRAIFIDDDYHHITKFCSLKQLPMLKELLLDKNDSALSQNIDKLVDAGCTELMPLLFNLLSHNNADVTIHAHRAIASFYPQDSDIRQRAESLEEQEFSQKNIIAFWLNINQPAPDVRYFQGEIFDIRNILRRNRTSPFRENLSDLIFDISIWSGQPFTIDPFAPYRKQFQQYSEIEQWFKQNGEQCRTKRWMLFGEEI